MVDLEAGPGSSTALALEPAPALNPVPELESAEHEPAQAEQSHTLPAVAAAADLLVAKTDDTDTASGPTPAPAAVSAPVLEAAPLDTAPVPAAADTTWNSSRRSTRS